ncbi:MAG TPA: ribulose-phosphate 3-epimerase [Candidatus Massiliomicrobiota merdigallinarum]|jgi:ribulose-phosphate 3-epimerase|uniref:ribulose-phosphate 3-epimerase n=1 Tax=unclassified Massilimicrobiota TaxID=2619866 RepID=UPI000B385056|nr:MULTISPECIES: ribulose-phosphate 3-epimerase [unclassified Massilimicrobiota]NJE43558.1 ribulose-phosphate 3-epimerase [Massilimicrobiota sp. SW1139]OUQ82160.1 ribulose-phosphate 3-epimerase [Massilimicrobiota sp. An105]HJA52930.1 ribulose-phosphate 3-epimerase [Candidatus Massilimicrobiota merdigallinarum]
MVKVAPSVLSANFAELKKDLDSIRECGADWIHYDVMDGHFVPNISFGYSILNDIAKVSDLYLDVHLMIEKPMQYVDAFIKSHASLITAHIEAFHHEQEVKTFIQYVHDQGVHVGLSVKPNTPISSIQQYLDDLDLVLVMSVEPGFGGQTFQEQALSKIHELCQLKQNRHYLIEVDGGINATTGQLCREAGVDVLVAGSYVFNAENRKEAIDSLK